MRPSHPLVVALIAMPLLGRSFLAPLGSSASADEVVAADPGQSGTVVGVATPPVAPRTGPVAVASRPRTIVVTQHGGRPVALFSDGLPVLRKPRPGRAPATFRGLRPGTAYTVIVGGQLVGKVTAVDRPTAATSLVVRTADTPDSVMLSWRHTLTKATGGGAIVYDIEAHSATAPDVATTVRRSTAARLDGLDPAALYTFSVTPRNSAGSGTATTARMTATLEQIRGVAPTPTPRPTATPSPSPSPSTTPAPPAPTPPTQTAVTPAPAPAPAPATVTIYVCPAGYADVLGVCQKSLAYTYDTKPYTTHEETYTYTAYGPSYTVRAGEIGPGPTCAPGWYPAWDNDPSQGSINPHCEQTRQDAYTATGTRTVRDATPAGYADTGTAWVRKNAPPPGYTDDGTQWITTAAKEARVVPA